MTEPKSDVDSCNLLLASLIPLAFRMPMRDAYVLSFIVLIVALTTFVLVMLG